jgi:hypothetical protein
MTMRKIEGQANLKSYITRFSKGLFREPEENSFNLDVDRTDYINQVTISDNELLTTPFNAKEIRDAVFVMEQNKAPGPDGFPAEFYQKFLGGHKRGFIEDAP